VAALKRQHFVQRVARRFTQLRPIARDVGRFPRGHGRQGGGRGHHLRLSVRLHAGLDDGPRRAPGPVQDHDRRYGDAGQKRDGERCAARRDQTLCLGNARGGTIVAPTYVNDSTIGLRDRLSRVVASLLRRLRGAGRRLLFPLALSCSLAFGVGVFVLAIRRSRLRLRRQNERQQPCDALFRACPGVTRPARAVLWLGDERRRRIAEHVVPARAAFLRKPDRDFVATFCVLMSVYVFSHGLGRDQTDMRVHRTHLPRDHEFRGWRRAARTPNKKMAAPRGAADACFDGTTRATRSRRSTETSLRPRHSPPDARWGPWGSRRSWRSRPPAPPRRRRPGLP